MPTRSSILYKVFCIKEFVGKNTRYLILNTRYRKSKGFSLIELLVVITIIAILIAAGTVSYTKAQQKGRDARRKTDLKTIQQALEQYFEQNGYYPPSNTYDWCSNISNPNLTIVHDALKIHINPVPTDPIYAGTSKDYVYKEEFTTGTYELAAYLENTNDPDRGSYPYSGCVNVDTTSPYNYKVTNP